MKVKPILAITIGDPAGIGPEIVVKTLTNSQIYEVARPLVIGDSSVIQQALTLCGINAELHPINAVANGKYTSGVIDIIDLNNIDCASLQFGVVQAMCGKAAYEYIAKATEFALNKQVAAVVTAPINKESLKAAHINHIGHTEILEALCDSPDPLTMFETQGIRTFFLSRHVSLRDACNLVTKERVTTYITKSIEALKNLGVEVKTFAVAGLNPHCGENGLFGEEELTAIVPAIQEARDLGYEVIGPISADAVFYLARQQQYSGILALHHDQGHIGMKSLDFEKTVSVTCGLPFVRTSVDHGTSFDKAGQGIASSVSMEEAIFAAVRYVSLAKCSQLSDFS